MCEKCLYRKNCQFLMTHKKSIVEDCTAFFSEEQYVAKFRSEAIKELSERLKDAYRDCKFVNITNVNARRFNERVDYCICVVDQIAKEMEKK